MITNLTTTLALVAAGGALIGAAFAVAVTVTLVEPERPNPEEIAAYLSRYYGDLKMPPRVGHFEAPWGETAR